MSLNKLTNCNKTLKFLEIGANCIDTKELKVNDIPYTEDKAENNSVSMYEKREIAENLWTWVEEEPTKFTFRFDEQFITTGTRPTNKAYGNKLIILKDEIENKAIWAFKYQGNKKAILNLDFHLEIENYQNQFVIPRSMSSLTTFDVIFYRENTIGEQTEVAYIRNNLISGDVRCHSVKSSTIELLPNDILKFYLKPSLNNTKPINPGVEDRFVVRNMNLEASIIDEEPIVI